MSETKTTIDSKPGLDRSRAQRGFCVMLTGLSGAGKSALARAFELEWERRSKERITTLDGDEVRKTLSSELGFSKAHRELNVERLGFAASLVATHGGGALIAAIAPYESGRLRAKAAVEGAQGLFCLVHVSTELSVCEGRDPKGLYKKARSGELALFTGVSDPYETPLRADLTLDMGALTVEQGASAIAEWLISRL